MADDSKLQRRFMAKVAKCESGCWIWTAAIGTHGYGEILVKGKKKKAHRVSYELFIGEIKALPGSDVRGTCVMHKCDNPRCVNPEHLMLGTHADNMADKKAKKRVVNNPLFGSKHQNSKLKESDVLEIRHLHKQGLSMAKIGSKFGVTAPTIHHVIHKITWSSV